jgi:hypothetical protein
VFVRFILGSDSQFTIKLFRITINSTFLFREDGWYRKKMKRATEDSDKGTEWNSFVQLYSNVQWDDKSWWSDLYSTIHNYKLDFPGIYTPSDIVFWTMYLTFVFLNPNGNLTVFFPLGSWYIMFNFVCGCINWIGLERVHFWKVLTFNLHIIWKATHHLFSYLKATPDQDILLSSTASLQLCAYCDSYWVSCPMTRQSTIGCRIFLGSSPISWKMKKQPVVSCDSIGLWLKLNIELWQWLLVN